MIQWEDFLYNLNKQELPKKQEEAFGKEIPGLVQSPLFFGGGGLWVDF